MITLLEKVIKKLENLPAKRQDSYASIIFDELDSEAQWDRLFDRTSARQIKKMEQMARSELRKSVTSLGSSEEPNDRKNNRKV